jgi:hypothetical protein
MTGGETGTGHAPFLNCTLKFIYNTGELRKSSVNVAEKYWTQLFVSMSPTVHGMPQLAY